MGVHAYLHPAVALPLAVGSEVHHTTFSCPDLKMARIGLVNRAVTEGERASRRLRARAIPVGFVTAQSTRHMHYTMTCLNGDWVVLVTITVRWLSDG